MKAVKLLIFMLACGASMGYEAKIWLTQDAVNSKGLSDTERADVSDFVSYDILDGPMNGSKALKAKETSLYFSGDLNVPISEEGTFMIWIRPHKMMRTGEGEPENTYEIAAVDKLFKFDLARSANKLDFRFSWENGTSRLNDMHILLPEIPGEEWMHFAFVWDAGDGIFNCYINGTPYLRKSRRLKQLDSEGGKKLSINTSQIAVSECRLYDKVIEESAIDHYIEQQNRGQMDDYLGIIPTRKFSLLGYFGSEDIEKELIFSSPLRAPKDVRGWVAEGPAQINFRKDGLVLESSVKDFDFATGHITFWCWANFPPNFLAEWNAQVLSENGACLVFFAARGQNGKDVYDASVDFRTGRSEDYTNGDIDLYSLSYYSDMPLGASRNASYLRLNSGRYLADLGIPGIDSKSNEVHKITLMRAGGQIQLAVDGWVIVDYQEDEERFGKLPTAGKIAFRQLKWTKVKYSDFKVYRLKKD
ncbi:DUF1961 family protein [Sedimentisphaera salicampi]|uniref:DUF1961 family protein n=1 Tax=Sedimentisphaera salicampi TaxID=1941349 RepID=UPI000B9C85E5|nr:DUF1961 family protein [Sedimentisphaera salicampi]OXU15104.1 hypothetical protein SMSP1_01034 [Sedimentisphaera salicampi]